MKLLTKAQFARKRKISKSRVTQLIREGKLRPTPDGRIDPIQAEIDFRNNMDPTRRLDLDKKPKRTQRKISIIPDKSNGESFLEIKKKHEILKAELTSLKLDVERGNLIPKDQSIAWLCLLVSTARTAFLNLPKRLKEVFAVLTDPTEIEIIHRKEIRLILEEMALYLAEKNKSEALEGETEDPEFELRLAKRRETISGERRRHNGRRKNHYRIRGGGR